MRGDYLGTLGSGVFNGFFGRKGSRCISHGGAGGGIWLWSNECGDGIAIRSKFFGWLWKAGGSSSGIEQTFDLLTGTLLLKSGGCISLPGSSGPKSSKNKHSGTSPPSGFRLDVAMAFRLAAPRHDSLEICFAISSPIAGSAAACRHCSKLFPGK